MKQMIHFLLVLLGFITTVVLIQAQSGFISIDCGLHENSSYYAHGTGIHYISDAKFIDTGVSNKIAFTNDIVLQELEYVRSFPNGVRNCYRINVTSGTKYLIRAFFYYGNYDNLNQPPQFDLHFGTNMWDTINASLTRIREIIYTPSKDYIQPCLVNTGKGTPFISAIELRPLNNITYVIDSANSVLSSAYRYDSGSITNSEYRYSYDVYDRIWEPLQFIGCTQVSSSFSLDRLAQNNYKPPAIVMRTAVTPVNPNGFINMIWESPNEYDQYYLYMHLSEVQELEANKTREFNINVNNKFWYGPIAPVYQEVTTILIPPPLTGSTITLSKTETSTLPPILNAFEIYKVENFSQSETQQDDVDSMTDLKNAYKLARNWQGDPCAPVDYMWEGLNCSSYDNGSLRITSLNLSSSGLAGQIISSISKLTMLRYLDLSNNMLSGPVPGFLTHMQSLKILNLGKNNLTGLVPSGLLQKSKEGSLSLSLDPNLCEPASCNQKTGDEKKKKDNIIIHVSVAVILVPLVLISAAGIIFFLQKRKPKASANSYVQSNTINESQLESKQRQNEPQLESKQRQYTYDEVDEITNNLNRILGRGGFGTVYYGLIDDTEVAVKMLSKSSVQGYQQFLAEVKLLMRVHHKNLTSLIGYCNEGNNIGLIYEYMANGNLDELLSGKNSRAKFLNWENRLRIAVDAAQGLEYLHNGCKPPIIHRDVKSTNILLNESFQAKLADFGLSKNFPTNGGTHLFTTVAGTLGYLDHEYMTSNRLTEKSDVYSFGVVILEIITSQPAIIETPDKTHISHWVRSMLYNGDIKNIVDSRLQQNFDTNSAWKAVEIGMACVSLNSSVRPNMSEVVNELKECLAAELARKRTGCRKTKKEGSIELVPLNLAIELSPLAR